MVTVVDSIICVTGSVNIIVLSAENVLARGHVIAKFDMATVKISDLEHVKVSHIDGFSVIGVLRLIVCFRVTFRLPAWDEAFCMVLLLGLLPHLMSDRMTVS